ncbi:RluA family pseudouridine synthase [Mangrovibacterium lignilyticum]|uniref:RluA family pseudouridine synthase n=1 Tax=Mangrovibacterium lignilyticum TaxID=2668052 RepID=UPI0019687994|nr:RluA family pseudouridine synthase [Mangrovibacterium lignilyticum]
MKKAIKKEFVTVNGELASTATFIRGGETICLAISKEILSQKKLILPLDVLFEDEYLAVIHKPAGILVSGNRFKTIANALPQNLRPSKLLDATIPKPVHRLDYGTTGVLLVGKASSSIQALNQLFADKVIEKTYYAVTIGEMKERGEITSDIEGKEARSHYRLIDSVPSPKFGQLNLLELKPQTGRRHQLRIHLSANGNPILGDKTYGTEGLILNGQGLYLHAWSLSFVHPFTGEKVCFIDELPQRFRNIFPDFSAVVKK